MKFVSVFYYTFIHFQVKLSHTKEHLLILNERQIRTIGINEGSTICYKG